jgi:hypothetical protein
MSDNEKAADPWWGFRGLGGAGEECESYTGGLQERIPAMSLKTTTSLIGSRAVVSAMTGVAVRVRLAMDTPVPLAIREIGAVTRAPPVVPRPWAVHVPATGEHAYVVAKISIAVLTSCSDHRALWAHGRSA